MGLWFQRAKNPLWWDGMAAGRYGDQSKKLRAHSLNDNLKAEKVNWK